jgi:EpsI family protein
MSLVNSMPKFYKPSLNLAVIMVILSILAFTLRPTQRMSEQNNQINLEAMIPQEFGDWKVDKSANTFFVDPTITERVNKTYLQSISRTYVKSNGERVMLAIAYGGDQNDMMQVHKPEICYAAQGFFVKKSNDAILRTDSDEFVVRRMLAEKGERLEPVTYWVTIGNKVAVNPVQWRLERIRYGLTGVVPDGLLFRVSTIGNDLNKEYSNQEVFIQDLVRSLDTISRSRILGTKESTF